MLSQLDMNGSLVFNSKDLGYTATSRGGLFCCELNNAAPTTVKFLDKLDYVTPLTSLLQRDKDDSKQKTDSRL